MSKEIERLPVDTVVDHGTREAWLAARKGGIGASESAALFGLSPFQSRFSLWMVKSGRLPDWEPEGDAAERLRWGQLLEEPIAKEHALRTGRNIWRFSNYCIAQDPHLPCMFATPDGFIIEAPDRRAQGLSEEGTLQIKNTANVFDPDGWSAGVPQYVQCQVQHELAVTGRDYATVATLAMGNKLMVWDIPRSEDFIAELRIQVELFWESVLANREPDPDGHPRTLDAIKRLHPKDNGCVVNLPPGALVAFEKWRSAKEAGKAAERLEKEAEAHLKSWMGPNTFGVLPDGTKLSLKTIDNAGYTPDVVKPYSYRVLRPTKEPLPAERAPDPPLLPPVPPVPPAPAGGDDELTVARKAKKTTKKGKAA
jgi:putative phage-type endonuclease